MKIPITINIYPETKRNCGQNMCPLHEQHEYFHFCTLPRPISRILPEHEDGSIGRSLECRKAEAEYLTNK